MVLYERRINGFGKGESLAVRRRERCGDYGVWQFESEEGIVWDFVL
jgi:hypothetical protein